MRLLKNRNALLSTAIFALGLLAATSFVWSKDRDHEQAKQLREAGEILPLENILQRAKQKYPGRVIETELENHRGRYVYELEIVDADGLVWELKYDAQSGEFLKRELED